MWNSLKPYLRRGPLFFSLAVCCLTAPSAANAFTTNRWTNSAGGGWETATSWSQGSVPDFDDFVRIITNGTYTVTVGNAAANTVPNSFTNTQIDITNSVGGRPTLEFTYTNAINFLLTTNGSGLRIGNATVNWNAPNAILSFGAGGNLDMNPSGFGTDGVLNIFSGRVNAVQPIIGAFEGVTSTINIYSGGVFAATSGDSRIGSRGTGLLNILGGTMVWSNQMFVGINATSTGRVVLSSGLLTIAGAGALMELGSGATQSSERGYGQLIMSNGLLVVVTSGSAGGIVVGAGPRSRGEFNMYGGTVTNGRIFRVGYGAGNAPNPSSATGTVLIAGGNWIDTSTLGWSLGGLSNSIGTVVISNGVVSFSAVNAKLQIGAADYATGEFDMAGGTMTFNGTNSLIDIGAFANSSGRLYVTGGTISLTTNSPGLVVGTNPAATSASVVLEGGRVELGKINIGPAGVLSNRTGGVLAFLGMDTVTGPSVANRIVDGGTLSYKNYSALNVTGAVAKFNIVSGSILQLDSSTNVNITGTYTLTNAANNFKTLSLTGTKPKWNSDNLQISSGGTLHVTNASGARLASVINNDGTILVQDSTVTYEKAVAVSGRYISDASTNTFSSNATVTASGTLEGGAGDLFEFKKSLFIHSTNNFGFNLLSSRVLFNGGGEHTNAITGRDLGTNGAGYAYNFAYDTLSLTSALDSICFESGDLAPSNALYVHFLDLANDTNLVANLHAPTNINLYYLLSEHDSRNAYLMDKTYELTDCDGGMGGLLIPAVPEPSTLAMLAMACCAFWRGRRRRTAVE